MRKIVAAMLAVVGSCTFVPSHSFAGPGLYDDAAKHKEMKTGDIDSQDYWWTKFDMTMLDLAISQRQPQGHIAVNLASTKTRIDDLLKEYPNHEEIKGWKAKVDDVMAKIDQDADRGASFKPGCPWDEANFAQLWVNFHWVKMLIDDKERDQAKGLLSNIDQNLAILTRPDRLKDYPEDLRKWVETLKPEVDKLHDAVK